MSDDRRSSPRRSASLAAEIDAGDQLVTIAITRDVAAGGLLVYTRAHLELGRAVKLKVSLGDRGVRELAGRVVREEPLSVDDSALWRTKVAIAIDDAEPVLAEIYRALADAS